MDFADNSEIEFNQFAQLQQIPPFNIKKVDSINFFNNERQESSINNSLNASNASNVLMSESRKRPSLLPQRSGTTS